MCFIDRVHHSFYKDHVLVFAHNNGIADNLHCNKPSFQITDDTLCKQVKNGGLFVKDVKELKARSLEYFNENMDSQFPPPYYQNNGELVSKWAEKMSTIFTSSDVKMIVGYNPVDHLELLGLEKAELQQILGDSATLTFTNTVIAINIKKRWIMASVVTYKTDHMAIGIELNKLNSILKSIYHSNVSSIKNEYIGIAGILVMPNVLSCSDLKTNQFIRWDPGVDQLFITKTEWNSNLDGLKRFAKSIGDQVQNNCQGIICYFFFYLSFSAKETTNFSFENDIAY